MLGVWLTVFSPNDISGLRGPKNVNFGTKVASSRRRMHALFGKSAVIAAKFAKNAKIRQKRQFYKTTRTVAPCIGRNSVYVAPPRSTEDTSCDVTLFVLIVCRYRQQYISIRVSVCPLSVPCLHLQ